MKKKHTPLANRIEWFLAVTLFGWGAWLTALPDTYALSEKIYAGMAVIASEETWGIIATIAGVAHIAALIVNGRFYLTPMIRGAAAGVGSTIWLVALISGAVNGSLMSDSMPIYLMLCAANWHVLILTGNDQKRCF